MGSGEEVELRTEDVSGLVYRVARWKLSDQDDYRGGQGGLWLLRYRI